MAFETPMSSGTSLLRSAQRWLWLTFYTRNERNNIDVEVVVVVAAAAAAAAA